MATAARGTTTPGRVIQAVSPLVWIGLACGFATGCDPRTQPTTILPASQPGTVTPSNSHTKPEPGYDLRERKLAVKGQVVRYERYFDGDGSTLEKASAKALSSDDEYIEKEITETEVTAVSEGRATELKKRYVEDMRWQKRKVRGGETKSKYLEGSLKGETLLGRKGATADWTFTMIGTEPNDEQRKRIKSMGRASPTRYPDYRVKPGDMWKIDLRDQSDLAIKEGIELSEGTMEFKFERLVELTHERLGLDKELCAEIKATAKMKGKLFLGGEIEVRVEATGTIHRSIDKRLDVQESTDLSMRMDGETANENVGLFRITATRKGKETVLRTFK